MPAESKSQRRLFGMAAAIQEGKLDPKSVSPEVRDIAKDVSHESVDHFAKTKEKNLPEKKGFLSNLANEVTAAKEHYHHYPNFEKDFLKRYGKPFDETNMSLDKATKSLYGSQKQATDLSPGHAARDHVPKKDFAMPNKHPEGHSETKGKYPIPDKCLSGDTLIPLLDGTSVPIKELVGKEVWVYSFDLDRKCIVPGLATDIHLTDRGRDVLKITLDSGESVTCTDNHPFLTIDLNYKLAGDLKIGDSLLPFYRRDGNLRDKKYEEVYQPYYKYWEFTHHMSWRGCNDKIIKVDNEIHHINLNNYDNAPTNLQELSKSEHAKLHAKILNPGKPKFSNSRWKKAEARNKASVRMKEENEFRRTSGRINEIAKKISDSKKDYWANKRKGIDKAYEMYLNGASLKDIANWWGVKEAKTVRNRFKAANLPLTKSNFYNHKIAKIEKVGKTDVYDLTVDKYHNFALDCGIFVHNSHARAALGFAAMHHGKDSAEYKAVAAKVHEKFGSFYDGFVKRAANYGFSKEVADSIFDSFLIS